MLSLILPGHYSLLKESPAEVKELETAGTTGKCHALTINVTGLYQLVYDCGRRINPEYKNIILKNTRQNGEENSVEPPPPESAALFISSRRSITKSLIARLTIDVPFHDPLQKPKK